jgi:hypothetical protein
MTHWEISERSGRGLFAVLSQHLPLGSDETHKTPVRILSVPARTRTEHLSNRGRVAATPTCSVDLPNSETRVCSVAFMVLRALTGGVTPCNLVDRCQHFGGTCCLDLQGRSLSHDLLLVRLELRSRSVFRLLFTLNM